MLAWAVILITGALVFYTVGVWGEKLQKTLKPWHLIFFYLGLFCDTTGTYLMSVIAGSGGGVNNHAFTGALALVLMLVHAIWATIVLVRKNQHTMEKFHRFSIGVWIVWLIPYFVGMIGNMI